MNKLFSKTTAFFMAMAMTFSLTACGGDDDNNSANEPEAPQQKYSEVIVRYSLSLSQDYYDLWDIEVTYTTVGGETKTELIDMDWTMEYRLNPADEIPEKYVFNVKGLPKAGVTVDPDKVYKLTKEHQFVATGVAPSGNVEVGGLSSALSSSLEVKGDKLAKRVADGITITEGEYKIKL